MSIEPKDEPAALLDRARAGDSEALDRLVALLYGDFRRIAAHLMRGERPDHTLQPSALVNEALVKLLGDDAFRAAPDRAFLHRAAARAMRQVLVDHHRRRSARKRSGLFRRVPLDRALDRVIAVDGLSIVDLGEALDRFAEVHERACLVVSFKVFLGMTMPEIGRALGISLPTVERDWQFARAWLRAELKPTARP